MDNSVIIKGNKHGIVVVMDENIPFAELKESLAEKFRSATKFFDKANMAVTFEGRRLTPEEEKEVLDIIARNSELNIICVIDNDKMRDEYYKKAVDEKLEELSTHTGQFYKGNLRNGDLLESEASIVIIGDVEKGAKVTARGNVIVLGTLKGSVSAGAAGNLNAVIVAFEMAPSQVKISDLNFQKAEKGKLLGRGPMMILVENGRICSEPIKKNFFSSLNFI